jgi:hypothetical protein
MAARCETVLNITMAEMETYHTQKREDFQTLTMEHLDGEIAFHEQVHFLFFISHSYDDNIFYFFLTRF